MDHECVESNVSESVGRLADKYEPCHDSFCLGSGDARAGIGSEFPARAGEYVAGRCKETFPCLSRRPSTEFRLGGTVTNPTTFNLNKLQAQPYHTTMWAFYRAGASFETGEWTGILLYDLLTQVQIILNPGVKNDLIRKVILVTATAINRPLRW